MAIIQTSLSKYQEQVIHLILEIPNEFNVPIPIEEQPGLLKIREFYQKGNGNFWIAIGRDAVVGTMALLDIGNHVALQKCFVRKDYRGKDIGIVQQLLNTLLDWAKNQSIREIYLGTTEAYKAGHRFYKKNDFTEISKFQLLHIFPLLRFDTKFYTYKIYGD